MKISFFNQFNFLLQYYRIFQLSYIFFLRRHFICMYIISSTRQNLQSIGQAFDFRERKSYKCSFVGFHRCKTIQCGIIQNPCIFYFFSFYTKNKHHDCTYIPLESYNYVHARKNGETLYLIH